MEWVIKQFFRLIKGSDNRGDTEATSLSLARFTVCLKSSLFVKENGNYDFWSAISVIISADGKIENFSDEKDHVVSSAIPCGTYVVIEATTLITRRPIKPFEVKITENNPTTPKF